MSPWRLLPPRWTFGRPRWTSVGRSRQSPTWPRSKSRRHGCCLGALKFAGAISLIAGIAMPFIGAAAAIGLVLFFVCAIFAHLRVSWYAALPFPIAFLLLAAVALVLRLASADNLWDFSPGLLNLKPVNWRVFRRAAVLPAIDPPATDTAIRIRRPLRPGGRPNPGRRTHCRVPHGHLSQ